MSKKKYKIIIIFILAILAVFFVSFQKQKNDISLKEVQTETKSLSVVKDVIDKNFFTIKAGDTILRPTYQSGQTLYDALVFLQKNNEITFLGKTYPSLGFFMTDIGSLHAGNGTNLIYYVNGKEAKVGVSSYIINKGDIILWKLE